MSRRVPTCGKCGRQHYNLVSCEKASRSVAGPAITWNTAFGEGFRPWGDKMGGYFNRLGENTFLLSKDDDGEETT